MKHIDYLKEPKSKCFLSQQLHGIVYEDAGATNIVAALEEARDVFKNARPNVHKVFCFFVNFLPKILKPTGGETVREAGC